MPPIIIKLLTLKEKNEIIFSPQFSNFGTKVFVERISFRTKIVDDKDQKHFKSESKEKEGSSSAMRNPSKFLRREAAKLTVVVRIQISLRLLLS